MGCFQILTLDVLGLQVFLILIRSVDMSYNGAVSDHHCWCMQPTGGSGFNQIGDIE